jgi:hypothetical protein
VNILVFLKDSWLEDKPLAQQYATLYNIVHHKEISVAHVMSQVPLNIGFRRALPETRVERWFHLARRLMDVNLTSQPDDFVRKLTTLVRSLLNLYILIL